jgi:glycerophosphoryl diester phosphodiesterase
MMPEIIGHRGARARFPENTMGGFRAALAAGIRSFEIDVGMTRDGVLVLSHDACLSPDLTRTDDGRWIKAGTLAIKDFTYAELQHFDVGRLRPGSKTAKAFPRQTPMDGETIPTLAAVLALHSRVRWTIEVKTYFNRPNLTLPPEAIVEAVASVVDAAKAAKRVIVQSFDWRGPRHLRQSRPDLTYAWLTSIKTRAWRGGQARLPYTVAEEGGGTWAPHHSELTPDLLARAKAAGLRVVPWTVNAPNDIARFARWGVDGIITDDPVVAQAVLYPAGLEPPPHPAPS